MKAMDLAVAQEDGWRKIALSLIDNAFALIDGQAGLALPLEV
jgi:hypothetical protein